MPRVSTDDTEVRYRKPRVNLYTALLVIALIALIVGCVLLYFELEAYEFKHKGAPSAGAATALPARVSLASTDRLPLSSSPQARMSKDARTAVRLLSL